MGREMDLKGLAFGILLIAAPAGRPLGLVSIHLLVEK
jgi:hypothetical protein